MPFFFFVFHCLFMNYSITVSLQYPLYLIQLSKHIIFITKMFSLGGYCDIVLDGMHALGDVKWEWNGIKRYLYYLAFVAAQVLVPVH